MNREELTAQLRKEMEEAKEELKRRESGLAELRTTVARLENAVAAMEGAFAVHDSRSYVAHRKAVEGRTRRVMSPEARERIRAAQKLRWDKARESEQAKQDNAARQTPLVAPKTPAKATNVPAK